jgi:acetyl esterase/lipase
MCSGASMPFWFGGDSNALNGVFSGRPALQAMSGPYFKGADIHDPLVSPGAHPEVLARFPPTLLVSGTRDIALSSLLMTHAALLDAGVDARLFVQEGLGHGHFFLFPGTRESARAYDAIWHFFDMQLAP